MKPRFTGNSAASFRGGPVSVPETRRCDRRKSQTRVVLLISDDSGLPEGLYRAAKANELIIAHASDLDEALRQLKATQPVAVLLDLDLADNLAWVIADQLLQQEDCPHLVFLTARMGHFDLEAASRAGSVMDKT